MRLRSTLLSPLVARFANHASASRSSPNANDNDNDGTQQSSIGGRGAILCVDQHAATYDQVRPVRQDLLVSCRLSPCWNRSSRLVPCHAMHWLYQSFFRRHFLTHLFYFPLVFWGTVPLRFAPSSSSLSFLTSIVQDLRYPSLVDGVVLPRRVHHNPCKERGSPWFGQWHGLRKARRFGPNCFQGLYGDYELWVRTALACVHASGDDAEVPL